MEEKEYQELKKNVFYPVLDFFLEKFKIKEYIITKKISNTEFQTTIGKLKIL